MINAVKPPPFQPNTSVKPPELPQTFASNGLALTPTSMSFLSSTSADQQLEINQPEGIVTNNQTQTVQSATQLEPKISRKEFDATFPKGNILGAKLVTVLILDGWGIGPPDGGNAIYLAKTPNIDRLTSSFPHTQLNASGMAVGLPDGTDGNTETGHLNIGAGTIVYQDLPRVDAAIAEGSFGRNPAFRKAIAHVQQHNSKLHFFGLVGDGRVHANVTHLHALLQLCKEQNISQVYIHAFTDGRDSAPDAGIHCLQQLQAKCQELGVGRIASVAGRFYAMDRDKHWDRVQKVYDMLTIGTNCAPDATEFLKQQYNQGITDEFIEPTHICDASGQPVLVQNNDAVIFFNYRVDRPRELTRAFVMPDFERGITKESYDPYCSDFNHGSHLQPKIVGALPTFQRKKVIQNLCFVTMTQYDDMLPVEVAFAPQEIRSSLGTTLANHGVRQLRITETEKERFITQFLNGHQEVSNPGEDWVVYPSKPVRSYDLAPEMDAPEIGNFIRNSINQHAHNVVLANICNGDMVGHTGNLEACVKACEVIDEQVGKIAEAVMANDGILVVTADHGNVEEVINPDGSPNTEHSTYPVPFIVAGKPFFRNPKILPTGILADIAPTVLHLLGVSKPEGMMGKHLINVHDF